MPSPPPMAICCIRRGRPNDPSVDEGLGEAVYWVAAIIFGYREDAAGLFGFGDHLLAGAGRKPHGFFAHRVPAALHGLDGHGVVMGR